MKRILALSFAAFVVGASGSARLPELTARKTDDGGIVILVEGSNLPLLVQNTPADTRSNLHPLVAPDGKGILTEMSLGHHKHQTGIDVGHLKVSRRDDWAHLAILDHSANPEHPIPWRIDGQQGVGPERSRVGDWGLKAGETYRTCYCSVVYTGKIDASRINSAWESFK